jgi:hypothetical protein
VKLFILALTILLCDLNAARRRPVPYSAVEVDKFVAAPGVDFPPDYQSALADDLAREISLAFPTVVIVHPGEATPDGHALFRISGVVARFNPGNPVKQHLIGFGAGGSVVQAQVWFIDAATGQVLLNRQLKGSIAVPGNGVGDSLARKIAKFCNAGRLAESN